MDQFIKPNEKGVDIVYNNRGAGCLYMGAGLMTIVSLIVFFILPSLSFFKAIVGVIIGSISLLFFGGILLRLPIVLKKRELISIENGYLINRKNKVALSDIKDIKFDWKNGTFKNLFVTTANNRTYYYPTYNIIPDDVISQFVEQYILPHAQPECRRRWEQTHQKLG